MKNLAFNDYYELTNAELMTIGGGNTYTLVDQSGTNPFTGESWHNVVTYTSEGADGFAWSYNSTPNGSWSLSISTPFGTFGESMSYSGGNNSSSC